MRLKIIILSILFLLVAIIASQNTNAAELKFLFWSVQAPLIVMSVVIFILIVINFPAIMKERKRGKKQEFRRKQQKKITL
jgi:uncharacterized integral membrane protein